MAMDSYTKTTWVNDGPPDINAENLNKMESGISDNRDAIISIQVDLATDEGAIEQLQTDVSGKVDKVEGKGLSANDYTDNEKSKLSGIAAGAQVNVKSNWNESNSSSDAFIQNKPSIPSKTSDLTNDSSFITAAQAPLQGVKGDAETDYRTGNVSITKANIGLGNVTNDAQVKRTEMGVADGVATLDSGGKVPSAQLPSFVDDVLEYDSISAFPGTGEAGKIYVALDTNKTYRWGGSSYVEISESLALGETSSTAYRGDRGKTAYDHSQVASGNPHNVSASDVGLGNVNNTADADKPVSTAMQTALNAKQNTLEWDSTPVKNSTKPVTSGGIFSDQERQDNEIEDLYDLAFNQDLDWAGIQRVVEKGLGAVAFPVGTQFEVAHSAYTKIVFDVLHHITPSSDAIHKAMLPAGKEYGMVLGMHSVIYDTQFDREEAFYFAENGLAAGTYNVTITRQPWYAADVGKTFQFTLASAVPAGGILCWGNYDASREGKNVSVYADRYSTSASQTAVMSEGSGGTALADINVFDRTVFGSNDWEESGIRQWLNANVASNWWTPKTIYDRIVSYYSRPGFLYGLDSDFKAVLLDVTSANRSNEVFDSHGTKQAYSTVDKIFLLSSEEVNFSSESGITCGKVFDYYASATDADRIKYDINNPSTARYWWLRVPIPHNAGSERNVAPSGALSYYSAGNGAGAAAACIIG